MKLSVKFEDAGETRDMDLKQARALIKSIEGGIAVMQRKAQEQIVFAVGDWAADVDKKVGKVISTWVGVGDERWVTVEYEWGGRRDAPAGCFHRGEVPSWGKK